MRHASNIAAPVIAVLGALTLLTVLYVVFSQAKIFPDHVERYMWTIAAHSRGTSKSEAITNLLGPQQRASDFLESNGFPARVIAIAAPSVYEGPAVPSDLRTQARWSASQDIAVPADTYARFARLSNRLSFYEQRRDDLTWSFPDPPFARFAKIVGFLTILLLCFSAVSLETRSADVNRAPRGMHPIMVAIQTMVLGLLMLISIVQGHVLALEGPRVLAIVLIVGLISMAAWLYKTLAWWKDNRFLRCAYPLYLAGFVAAIAFGAWAIMIPVT